MNRTKLQLNCDLGESYGAWSMGMDAAVMPLIDMANIACGFHAGDPLTLSRTVSLAKQHHTQIGAHPSYPDLVGFGRRSMQCSPQELIALLHYQIGALQGICQAQDVSISYVKPHGALYNDMLRQPAILRAVVQAIAKYDVNLPLMVLAQSDNRNVQKIADEFSVTLLFEAFADRAYEDDGQLLSRQQPGAVFQDAEQIINQALQLAEQGIIKTIHGQSLALNADSLCVHGDNQASVQALQQLRQALDDFYAQA
ncbi:MAG: 5-oxoprolinase subunit PxpA [Methylophaga sp.]|nr:5-oxoprolinase subunit PxpA [Methylophaga sp.]